MACVGAGCCRARPVPQPCAHELYAPLRSVLTAAVCRIPPEAPAARGAGRRLWSDSHAEHQRSHANRRPARQRRPLPRAVGGVHAGTGRPEDHDSHPGRGLAVPRRRRCSIPVAAARRTAVTPGLPARVSIASRFALPGRLAQLARLSEGVDPPIDRRRVRRGRCAARRAGCQWCRPAGRLRR